MDKSVVNLYGGFKAIHLVFFLCLAFVVSVGLVALSPSRSFAADDMSVNSRLAGGNAGAYCAAHGNLAFGMVWISNDGSNYYSETVSIGQFASSTYIQVRGALNTCSSSFRSAPADVYAINVSSGTSALGISGTQFYRGGVPQGVARYAWSSRGGYLDASLNVSGVAQCSAAGVPVSATLNVTVYRELMYVQSGNNLYRPPISPESIDVKIVRDCPLDYTLTPSITTNPSAASPGTTVQPAPVINNTGSSASNGNQWQVTTFTIAPGRPVPGGGLDGSTPTAHYGNGATVISSGNQAFPRGNQPLSAPAQTIADLPVGTKVCFALSVQPVTQADGRWSHSAPACVTVAKSPKVDVLGGDLNVGHSSVTKSNIITSVSNKSGQFYGSWGEYGIVPTGVVTGMASGSGYVGGATTGDICQLSILTFTVGGSGGGCGVVGNYTQTTPAPNISASFIITVPAASAGPGNPASPAVLPSSSISLIGNNLSGEYQAQAGVTSIDLVGSGDIPKGRSIIINAPAATVTIRGDIKYTGQPLGSMSDIPQVVIIAKNIIIADNVTNVDAWLVATGTGTEGKVNTCGAGGVSETSDLVYTQCNQKLTVNGPVIANHLIMRRTAGSGTGAQSGDPAEVFNLRADAYIWASNYNLKSGRITTVVVTELPPRF